MSCSETGGRPSRPCLLTFIWQHLGDTYGSVDWASSQRCFTFTPGSCPVRNTKTSSSVSAGWRVLPKCTSISHFPPAHFPDSSWKVKYLSGRWRRGGKRRTYRLKVGETLKPAEAESSVTPLAYSWLVEFHYIRDCQLVSNWERTFDPVDFSRAAYKMSEKKNFWRPVAHCFHTLLSRAYRAWWRNAAHFISWTSLLLHAFRKKSAAKAK